MVSPWMIRGQVCQLCGADFTVERKPGKPRSYCFECQPVGTKLVMKRGKLKLRRWPPAYSMAELQDPARTPADIQQTVRQILAGHERRRRGGQDAA